MSLNLERPSAATKEVGSQKSVKHLRCLGTCTQIAQKSYLSKIEAGRMDVNAQTFDVRRIILSATDVVSPLLQEGVELKTDIAEDIGEANTDQQRIQQMLINLLSNAVKFTDEGRVTVTARREEGKGRREKGDAVTAFPANGSRTTANGQLVIAIGDTGRGIPENELPTLFDEYRQVEGQSESAVQRGTGLGLSITERFVELLGGSIQVESEVGQGSTFTVTIPDDWQAETEERD